MFRYFSIILSAIAISLFAAPAQAAINDFVGTWQNTNAATSGITRIVVKRVTNDVEVRVFGKCSPNDCDWGAVSASVYGPGAAKNAFAHSKSIVAVFDKGFAETIVVLSKNGNKISGSFFTRFTDGSGRSNYAKTHVFQKQLIAIPVQPLPMGTFKEDCVSFNNDNLAVKNINGRIKIVDGNHYLLDFGSNVSEASDALVTLKTHGFTEHCFVGRPGPSFDYWLKNDGAVSGSGAGEDCLAFNKDNLRVKKINGNWKIVDGSSWMFDFGAKQAEARKSLRAIKKHGFNKTCYLGRPGPSLTYLLK